jgi:hypothetical protein
MAAEKSFQNQNAPRRSRYRTLSGSISFTSQAVTRERAVAAFSVISRYSGASMRVLFEEIVVALRSRVTGY